MVGAETPDIGDIVGAARGRDARAERVRDLDAEAADAARTAVDKHGLPGLQLANIDETAIGRRPRDRKRGRLRKAPPVRQRRDKNRVGDAIFGVGAIAPLPLSGHAENAVAGSKRIDTLADRLDNAGKVETQHEREMIVDIGRQLAHARFPVGGVDPGADDPDQHLARAGFGCGQLAPDKLFGAAEPVDHHRAHAILLIDRWQKVRPRHAAAPAPSAPEAERGPVPARFIIVALDKAEAGRGVIARGQHPLVGEIVDREAKRQPLGGQREFGAGVQDRMIGRAHQRRILDVDPDETAIGGVEAEARIDAVR